MHSQSYSSHQDYYLSHTIDYPIIPPDIIILPTIAVLLSITHLLYTYLQGCARVCVYIDQYLRTHTIGSPARNIRAREADGAVEHHTAEHRIKFLSLSSNHLLRRHHQTQVKHTHTHIELATL